MTTACVFFVLHLPGWYAISQPELRSNRGSNAITLLQRILFYGSDLYNHSLFLLPHLSSNHFNRAKRVNNGLFAVVSAIPIRGKLILCVEQMLFHLKETTFPRRFCSKFSWSLMWIDSAVTLPAPQLSTFCRLITGFLICCEAQGWWFFLFGASYSSSKTFT